MRELSLVICTRNRDGRLGRTLEEVARLRTGADWELVVVDNASTDRTATVLTDFARDAGFPVVTEFEERPGLNRARNRGCRAASGRVIATIDDDCYPRPDFVGQTLEVFGRHGVGFIGGRVLLYDRSDAEMTVRTETTAEMLPPNSVPPTGFVLGANMAFRREVFDDVGGFDETLGVGTPFVCGDIEFCARASVRGWAGGYFPGPVVRHHHGRRSAAEVAALRAGYARGRGAYFTKGMLSYPGARMGCAKRWYWTARTEPPRLVAREVGGALLYVGHRLAAAAGDALGPGRSGP